MYVILIAIVVLGVSSQTNAVLLSPDRTDIEDFLFNNIENSSLSDANVTGLYATYGCENGGKCNDKGICDCLPNTSGVRCETVDCNSTFPKCEESGGKCNYSDRYKQFYCDCPQTYFFNYTSNECQALTGACENVKCLNGAMCNESGICDCLQYTSGKNCEIVDCEPVAPSCELYEGTCMYNISAEYPYCECAGTEVFNRESKECQDKCDEDWYDNCLNFGTCNEQGFCECLANTTGPRCGEVDCSGVAPRCGESGGTCRLRSPDNPYCYCYLPKVFQPKSGECKDFCKIKCGYDKEIKCSGYKTEDDDPICGCASDKYVYLPFLKMCKSRCFLKCGSDPGLQCTGAQTTAEKTICGCRSGREIYDPLTKTCVSRCKAKCGTDSGVYCTGYQTADYNTVCDCRDDQEIYVPLLKACMSRCKAKCGTNSGVRCTGYQTAEYNTVCGCRDDKEIYVPLMKACMNSCKFNPCQNGGTCLSQGPTFRCKCKKMFTGAMCENENLALRMEIGGLTLVILVLFVLVFGAIFIVNMNRKLNRMALYSGAQRTQSTMNLTPN